MSDLEGRRREDQLFGVTPSDLKPGDIWKIANPPAQYAPGPQNLTGTVWAYLPPCAVSESGWGILCLHTVREHPDGSVSILPGDGSSNSVLYSGEGSWHGYIYNGVWRSV